MTRLPLDGFSLSYILRWGGEVLHSVGKLKVWLETARISDTLHDDLRTLNSAVVTNITMVAVFSNDDDNNNNKAYSISYN